MWFSISIWNIKHTNIMSELSIMKLPFITRWKWNYKRFVLIREFSKINITVNQLTIIWNWTLTQRGWIRHLVKIILKYIYIYFWVILGHLVLTLNKSGGLVQCGLERKTWQQTTLFHLYTSFLLHVKFTLNNTVILISP